MAKISATVWIDPPRVTFEMDEAQVAAFEEAVAHGHVDARLVIDVFADAPDPTRGSGPMTDASAAVKPLGGGVFVGVTLSDLRRD